MRVDHTKLDLVRLEKELKAAGISVRALGIDRGDLHTYTSEGTKAPLPPQARPVVLAHQATIVQQREQQRENIKEQQREKRRAKFRIARQRLSEANNLADVRRVFEALLDALEKVEEDE